MGRIGTVPYLLRLMSNISLIGSRLTLAVLEALLEELRIRPVAHVLEEGRRSASAPSTSSGSVADPMSGTCSWAPAARVSRQRR